MASASLRDAKVASSNLAGDMYFCIFGSLKIDDGEHAHGTM